MTSTEKYDQKPQTAQQENKTRGHTPPLWFFWRARRYVVILLMFFGLACTYAMRTSFSIAIVAMTELKYVTLDNGTQILKRDFEWDTVLQGYSLSAYFYGFMVAQLISGYMSVRSSGKIIIAAGIGVTSVMTLLTPLIANINVYLFLVFRALTGFSEGITAPALVSVWAKWTPPLERNRLINFCVAGSYFGMIISLQFSALVSQAFGWASIFYLFGGLGTLWTILWTFIVSNSPHEDSRISDDELNYLIETLKLSPTKKVVKTPWKDLLTSTAVWALFVLVFVECWGFYTLLTHMPKFMRYVLNFELYETGVMSSLPYVLLMVMVMVSSIIADFVFKRGLIARTTLRRLSVGIGFSFQCIFSILAVFWLSRIGSTFCLLIAVGFGGWASAVIMVNYLDLSPQFGSLIMGLGNIMGNLPGIVSPTLTGYIVTEEDNVDQWRIIFYISAVLYFLGLIFYSTFGSGEIQKWNDPENIQKVEEQK